MKIWKNKLPFRVPLRLRIKYFLASRRWLEGASVFVLFVIVFLATAWAIAQISFVAPLFRDPGFAGLFGALFGAVLGAIVGALTSFQVQSQQLKADASIRKKEEIYQPLYDALVDFKDQIEQHPYSGSFYLGSDDPVFSDTLRLSQWAEIKKDSRSIQVPKWIADALDQHLLDVKAYSRIRSKAFDDLKVSLPSVGYVWSVDSEDNELIVSEILAGKLVNPAMFHPGPGRYRDCAQVAELWSAVQGEADKLESVRKVRSFYQESIVDHTEWLIREISKLIRYIEVKYEVQSDLV